MCVCVRLLENVEVAKRRFGKSHPETYTYHHDSHPTAAMTKTHRPQFAQVGDPPISVGYA